MTKPELLAHLRNDHRSYARVRDGAAELEELHGLLHDPAWTGATRTKFVRKQEGWVSFGPPNHTHPRSG